MMLAIVVLFVVLSLLDTHNSLIKVAMAQLQMDVDVPAAEPLPAQQEEGGELQSPEHHLKESVDDALKQWLNQQDAKEPKEAVDANTTIATTNSSSHLSTSSDDVQQTIAPPPPPMINELAARSTNTTTGSSAMTDEQIQSTYHAMLSEQPGILDKVEAAAGGNDEPNEVKEVAQDNNDDATIAAAGDLTTTAEDKTDDTAWREIPFRAEEHYGGGLEEQQQDVPVPAPIMPSGEPPEPQSPPSFDNNVFYVSDGNMPSNDANSLSQVTFFFFIVAVAVAIACYYCRDQLIPHLRTARDLVVRTLCFWRRKQSTMRLSTAELTNTRGGRVSGENWNWN